MMSKFLTTNRQLVLLNTALLVVPTVVLLLPQIAMASDLNAIRPGAMSMMWSRTTLVALVSVAMLGVLSFSFFHVMRVFRWVPRDREIQVSRALQIAFGALLLFAATLPYLFVNFPILGPAVLVVVGVLAVSALLRSDGTQIPDA